VNLAPSTTKNSEALHISYFSTLGVYECGYYNDNVAALWHNTTLIPLPVGDGDSRATHVTYGADQKIYVSGYYNNGPDLIAAYWVYDGTTATKHDLTTGPDRAMAYSMTGDYVAGEENDLPVYWKLDGTKVDLSVPAGATGKATDIKSLGATETFIVGSVVKDGIEKITYWQVTTEGTISTDLGAGVRLASPSVDWEDENTNIYISGSNESGATMQACYWMKPLAVGSAVTKTDLDVGGIIYSMATSVRLMHHDIYVAGYYSDSESSPTFIKPAYWTNGPRTDLDTGDVAKVMANSISVDY
jgi:hypothetical protein